MDLISLLLICAVSSCLAYYLFVVPIKLLRTLGNIPSPKNAIPLLGNAMEMWKAQYRKCNFILMASLIKSGSIS